MKLLLDQNISYRVIKKIEHLFPDSEQVRRLGLENSPDKTIWEYAKKNEFIIVTFDSDFYDLSLLHGHPPKLIWIKSGNTTTENPADILTGRIMAIRSFISDNELSCLEIN